MNQNITHNFYNCMLHKNAAIIILRLFCPMLIALSAVLIFSTPAFATLSIEDEIKIGREFHQRLAKSNLLIKDKRIINYINSVGQRIVANIPRGPFEFHFFVIKSSAINAFATPGGYVYINMGLINLAENESQLASVMAHEIAHVNLRHIASMIERSQKINIAAIAAIIAGAFLGGGGDLTAAVAGFSLATASAMSLKYSREHEEEADRLGLSYLVSAGYNSQSAPDFLKNMRRYEFHSNNVPSYFLTHPGIVDRIRYLDSLIQTRFPPTGQDNIIGNFRRIKTLLLLAQGDNMANLRSFSFDVNNDPSDIDALYGLAVTQERIGQVTQALANFRKALSLAPDDEDILKAMGISYLKYGLHDEAITLLGRALSFDQGNPDIILHIGKAYIAKGDYQNAISIMTAAERKGVDFTADYYYSLATAYGRLNNHGESHFHFGKYFKKIGNNRAALFHYQEAAKFIHVNSARGSEVRAEINQLKATVKPRKR